MHTDQPPSENLKTADDVVGRSPSSTASEGGGTTVPPLIERLNHSSGSFELVGSTLIMALFGAWLDRSVTGTSPWLTVTFAVLGLVGAVTKLYLDYTTRMTRLAEERRVASQARAEAEAARHAARLGELLDMDAEVTIDRRVAS